MMKFESGPYYGIKNWSFESYCSNQMLSLITSQGIDGKYTWATIQIAAEINKLKVYLGTPAAPQG